MATKFDQLKADLARVNDAMEMREKLIDEMVARWGSQIEFVRYDSGDPDDSLYQIKWPMQRKVEQIEKFLSEAESWEGATDGE